MIKFNLVDLWDPETDSEIIANEPIIYHGGTMTSRLLLSSVLKVINELAFEKSRFKFNFSIIYINIFF